MEAVKNIIFDLGGIFLDLDYSLTRDAFIKAGVAGFDDFYTQHHANPLFEQLETGQISPEDFYDGFRTATGTTLSNSEIEKAWNAMLIAFPPERIDWLGKIKEKYRLYLFSNTNQIHYDAIMALYRRDLGNDGFNDFFIHPYYSHEFGLRKPYPSSYTELLHRENLLAHETLFIDDTHKNIVGAQEAGLQVLHLAPPNTVLGLSL